jgi:RNA polymerase sigma factor (TIGR02999 family)
MLQMSDATRILDRVQQGDPQAAEELLPLVYEELRELAAHRMAGEAAGHTLQPTALVHEAWLRLVGDAPPTFENRGHFFSAAAEPMRRILVEKARRKHRVRHGGELKRVEGTGIYKSFAGGHNHMVDILHYLADGRQDEYCFCNISRP